jgi:hydrophobic/amphiphilic exporter-1 (mainly G- bacteria), HAE1 family
MSRFAIRYPYLIIVLCLVIGVVGTSSLVRMPVDLFPPINIPVVVVATFYSGLPPEDIENDITGTFERFFTVLLQFSWEIDVPCEAAVAQVHAQ